MIKKLLYVGLVSLCASCTYVQETPLCPNVIIHKGNDSLVQNAVGNGQFKIKLTGYEGYCFMDEKINRAKARIVPLFHIYRLNNLDETDVHFSYYTDTLQGPPQYLGKRFYNETVNIPYAVRQKVFRGRPVETKIPDISGANFEVALGLAAERESVSTYQPQSYTFRYAVDDDELQRRSSYETIPDHYGMEMYYAEQTQQELERQQSASVQPVYYNQGDLRKTRFVSQPAPEVVFYPQEATPAKPMPSSVNKITYRPRVSSQTQTTSAKNTQVTIETRAPEQVYAAQASGGQRQIKRRFNCKNCR